MTKASIIGIAAAILVVIAAFLPWISVESKHFLFTGLQTTGSAFGEPGKVNVFMAVVSAVLFLLNKSWSARPNIFVSGFLMAWTFRNYLIFSRCEAGECPDVKLGLILSLAGGIVCFLCVVLNRTKVAVRKGDAA